MVVTTLVLLSSSLMLVSCQQCGQFTTPDTPGPFFVETGVINNVLAPDNELRDPGAVNISDWSVVRQY